MEVANEAHIKYCSFCGKKVSEPVLYRGYLFCSTQCKESFISSKEGLKDIVGLRSIRSFKWKEIPEDVLKIILEAGRHAPTAHNVQPWHFVVVSDPQIKRKLAKGKARFVENSALTIVGCGDPRESPRWHEIEVAIALQNMVLAAWLQGVGSCWVDIGANEEEVKAVLGIPKQLKVVGLVAFGYPAKIPKPTWKKNLEQIIHYNKF